MSTRKHFSILLVSAVVAGSLSVSAPVWGRPLHQGVTASPTLWTGKVEPFLAKGWHRLISTLRKVSVTIDPDSTTPTPPSGNEEAPPLDRALGSQQ